MRPGVGSVAALRARTIQDVRGLYIAAARLLSAALLAIGLAMVSVTVVSGGGPLALGVVAGIALCVLGSLRLLALRRSR